MTRPLLLDTFCKAGGAAAGYHRAGFDILGVDIEPQPNYPFRFIQADALVFLARMVNGDVCEWGWPGQFAAVHASPPCQAHSTQTADKSRHVDLIPPTRDLLQQWGIPYVIENVVGSPLIDPIQLCGSSFGLDVRRHRRFEANWPIVGKPCDHAWQTPRFRSLDIKRVRIGSLASVVGVHGHLNYPGEFALRCAAMGIDWMDNDELVQAVPPAYTEHVGRQLLEAL